MTERNKQKMKMKRKDATELLDEFNQEVAACDQHLTPQSHQEIQVIAMLCRKAAKTAFRHAHSLYGLIRFQSVVSEEVNSALRNTHSDS